MRKVVLTIALCLLGTMPAFAADYIDRYVPAAEIVGEGRLRVFMLDVYDAELYAPNGEFASGEPLALRLSYLRSIPGKKIADRSLDEIKDQERWDDGKLEAWHQEMLELFPDVEEGDVLTGVLTKSGETLFFKDGEKIATVEDPEFGTAFFNIWLSEGTNSPTLRKKLLGKLAEANL